MLMAATDDGPEIAHGGWLLIAAWLAPPLIWLAQLQLAYALVGPACTAQHRMPMYAASVVAALLAAAVGAAVWREWRRHGSALGEARTAPRRSSSFVALVGVLVSAQFLLIIVLQAIAMTMLSPCE
jgi:hypothetical protein